MESCKDNPFSTIVKKINFQLLFGILVVISMSTIVGAGIVAFYVTKSVVPSVLASIGVALSEFSMLWALMSRV